MFSMLLTKSDRPRRSAVSLETMQQAGAAPPQQKNNSRQAEPDTRPGDPAPVVQSSGTEVPQSLDAPPGTPATDPNETMAPTPRCDVLESAIADAELTATTDHKAIGDVASEAMNDATEGSNETPPADSEIAAPAAFLPPTMVTPPPACAASPTSPANPQSSDGASGAVTAVTAGASGVSTPSASIVSGTGENDATSSNEKASVSLPIAARPPMAPKGESAAQSPSAVASPTPDQASATPQSDTPARTPHVAGPSLAGSPKQPERDPIPAHQPGDLMLSMRPDGLHLSSMIGGPDLAQMIAPAAPVAPAKDGTGLAAAAVPLDGLAVEIAARANHGHNRFEIRLDPPELGRIEVRLDIDRSGLITSRLVVERTETLDVLRRDAHQLERALQDAGLQTANNGLQFTLRDQGFSDRNPSFDPLHGAFAESDQPVAGATSVTLTLRGNGGVDIRV
jgi:hypothetical protein